LGGVETDTESERETERETQRQIGRHRDREADTETERQTDTHTQRQGQTERQGLCCEFIKVVRNVQNILILIQFYPDKAEDSFTEKRCS